MVIVRHGDQKYKVLPESKATLEVSSLGQEYNRDLPEKHFVLVQKELSWYAKETK